jgi:hypothetical protein
MTWKPTCMVAPPAWLSAVVNAPRSASEATWVMVVCHQAVPRRVITHR